MLVSRQSQYGMGISLQGVQSNHAPAMMHDNDFQTRRDTKKMAKSEFRVEGFGILDARI